MPILLPMFEEALSRIAPSDLRRRRSGLAGAGVPIAVLLAAWLACGCAVGVTHRREVVSQSQLDAIELSPGEDRVAVGVTVDQVHLPNGLGQFPDGGVPLYEKRTFELLVFDLAPRGPLTRLASLERSATEQFHLLYWDPTGIYVRAASGHSKRVIRIDPATGHPETLPAASVPAADARWSALHPGRSLGDERRERHVYERNRQFFLWNPETGQAEYLFDLPASWDGHREARGPDADARREQRLRDSFLEVWAASIRQERDSVRVTLATHAIRPGDSVRPYRVTATLSMPDTIALRRGVSRSMAVALPPSSRVLIPSTTHVDAVFAYEDLRRELVPYGRYLSAWPPDSVRIALDVRLEPASLPSDSLETASPSYRGGGQVVMVSVPARGLFPSRPAGERDAGDRDTRQDARAPSH